MLLESMVLLAAGTQWGGSWTQRLYGTGNADLWEIMGNSEDATKYYSNTPIITNTAWKQGWRVLEPYQVTNYANSVYHEVVNDTLGERCPSLVLMQTPPRIWKASHAGSRNENADRQKRKRIRELVKPFLASAKDVALRQIRDNRDFILEVPHVFCKMSQGTFHDMLKAPDTRCMVKKYLVDRIFFSFG